MQTHALKTRLSQLKTMHYKHINNSGN